MKIWFNKKLEQDLSKIASAEAEGLVPDVGGQAAAEPDAAGRKQPVAEQPQPAAPADAPKPAAPAAPKIEQRLRVVSRKPEDIGAAEHKSLYREILAGMYDAVLVTDPSGRVIDCNDRAVEYFGYAKPELWDQPIEVLIHSINSQLLERLRKTIAASRHVLLDTQCHAKDGASFAAEVAVSGIRLVNDGDIVFFVRNTEKRHRAQKRLRSEHNAIMASTTAFALCAPDGTIQFSNPALATIWGFAAETEVDGTDIRELFQESDAFGQLVDSAMLGEGWTGELDAAAGDGRLFRMAGSVNPDRDIQGHVIGVVCSFHEVGK